MRSILLLLLLLHVLLLPFERVLRLVSDSGEDSILKPYRVVGLLFSALWLAWRLATGRRIRLDVGDKSFIGLFTLGAVMALIWHLIEDNNLDYTIRGLQLISFGVALYIATKDLALSGREIDRLLMAYTVIQIVGVVLAEFLVGETGGRMRALYRNPNQLGIACANCLIFLFAQFVLLPRARLGGQLMRVFAATFFAAVIALTGSRGASAGALAGCLAVPLIVVFSGRRGGIASPRLLAFAALIGVLVLLGYSRFEQVWDQTDAQSRFQRDVAEVGAEGRWELWRGGWHVGWEHYGVGVGMFQYLTYHLEAMRDLRIPTSSADRPLGTHSDYVDLFVSYGVLGVFIFVRYIAIRARSLWVACRATVGHENDQYAPMGLALLVAALVFQISQNSFQGTEYFLMMSLIDSMARLSEAPARAASAPASLAHQFRRAAS